MADLCFDDSIDDSLKGLMAVAFDDALNKTRSPPHSLPHGHVEVVVGLLCGKILYTVCNRVNAERERERAIHKHIQKTVYCYNRFH